jgi:3D (Asp-Asp-Asp) domain-containing protein
MKDIELILAVIAGIAIGCFCHIWYVQNIHTGGSGETPPTANVAGSPESFLKTMRVSAFCPCAKCCGRWANIYPRRTASGHVIRPGDRFVAAAKDVPFGTMIDIPGYGRVPVLDRGSAIKGDRLDVFFDDSGGKIGHQRALEWGVRNLDVKIAKEIK